MSLPAFGIVIIFFFFLFFFFFCYSDRCEEVSHCRFSLCLSDSLIANDLEQFFHVLIGYPCIVFGEMSAHVFSHFLIDFKKIYA